jgi:signal transduction histidine kinase
LSNRKQAIYARLEREYGLKPAGIAQHYDVFYDAITCFFPRNTSFNIIRDIVRILHSRGQNGKYPETVAIEAFNRIVTVNMSKANVVLKNAQASFVDQKFNLKEKNRVMRAKTKSLVRELEEAQRLSAIGQTAGMVGHDIRNPLQSITGEVYLMKTELDSLPNNQTKENLKESIDLIQKNVEYINKIVADLQDFAKRLNPRKERLSIQTVIRDALSIVTLPSEIQVDIKIEEENKMAIADRDMTKRILSNLIQNAVQAMPQGGKLTLQEESNGHYVIISVIDTGVGIPKEAKKKIFTPLFTTKSKGQGLGLAVVKRLVEAQGGTIRFESEEGKGTSFIVQFPTLN